MQVRGYLIWISELKEGGHNGKEVIMGRKKKLITKEVIRKAEKHAAQGLSREQIAHVLGLGVSTLYEKLNDYPELLEAINRGKSKGLEQITNALFKKATGGDVTAQKYYLNNRDNDRWKDRIESKAEVVHTFSDDLKKALYKGDDEKR